MVKKTEERRVNKKEQKKDLRYVIIEGCEEEAGWVEELLKQVEAISPKVLASLGWKR